MTKLAIYQDLVQLADSARMAAESLSASEFYKQYEERLEWDEIDNLWDFDAGNCNLIYHGSDRCITILFYNGVYVDWGLPG